MVRAMAGDVDVLCVDEDVEAVEWSCEVDERGRRAGGRG